MPPPSSRLPVLLTFPSWLITTANIFTFLACRLISSKSLATSPPIHELNTAAPPSITSTHVNPAPPCIRRSHSVRPTHIHTATPSSSPHTPTPLHHPSSVRHNEPSA